MHNHKPGWTYIDCVPLSQRIAVHEETGWVFCEDSTKYSPKEIDLMENAGTEITPPVHRVKKILGGEIVGIKSET